MTVEWVHAENLRGTGQRLVCKYTAGPPLALTLRLSIARGRVNREAATVMLQNYSIELYSTVSTKTCISPKPVTQAHARTDTQTHTHRYNLYKGCSLINIQRWQSWLTFELLAPVEGLTPAHKDNDKLRGRSSLWRGQSRDSTKLLCCVVNAESANYMQGLL